MLDQNQEGWRMSEFERAGGVVFTFRFLVVNSANIRAEDTILLANGRFMEGWIKTLERTKFDEAYYHNGRAPFDSPLSPGSTRADDHIFDDEGFGRVIYLNTIHFCPISREWWQPRDALFTWDLRQAIIKSPNAMADKFSSVRPWTIKRNYDDGYCLRDHRRAGPWVFRSPEALGMVNQSLELKKWLHGLPSIFSSKTPKKTVAKCVRRHLVRSAKLAPISRAERNFFAMMFGASKVAAWCKQQTESYEPNIKLQAAS